MARHSKVEVAAVNVRIPATHKRDYPALVERLATLKRGIKVYGDSFVAISYYDRVNNIGIFSKYTEIDIDGEWFDLEDFDTAAPEKIDEINIPGSLRPNHFRFYFLLDEAQHIIPFELYSESKGLSANSVEKFFRSACAWPEIQAEFGRVQADIIKDYADVEALLGADHLREVKLIVRRPNTDDLGDDLAAVIEERLKKQKADEYEESIKSRTNDLAPDERTRKLASVAAENGLVRTRSIINGVMVPRDSSKTPLIEVTKYSPDESELNVFRHLAAAISARVLAARKAVRGEQ